MSTVLGILVVLHIVCWAIGFGAWAAAARTREPVRGMAHALSGAVVLGILAMIVRMTMADGGHMFYGLKLVLAVIAMACAWIAISKRRETSAVVWYAIPVAVLANIVIGVFGIGA